MRAAALCSLEERTCGACCWGSFMGRHELARHLRRHRRLSKGWRRGRQVPSRIRLIFHELRTRYGLSLFWGVLLKVPGVHRKLQSRLRERMVCPFVAFLDDEEALVGCLLHPTRWSGQDVRAERAFQLLAGFGCGTPEFLCSAAERYQLASDDEADRFDRKTRGLDWHAFATRVMRYGTEGQQKAAERSQKTENHASRTANAWIHRR